VFSPIDLIENLFQMQAHA